MVTTKTATLTFRIDTGVKEALRTAAQQEHRSIANMVEVLIRGATAGAMASLSKSRHQSPEQERSGNNQQRQQKGAMPWRRLTT